MEPETIPLTNYIESLSIENFIDLFVFVEDKAVGRAVKMKLYTAQRRVIRKIDKAISVGDKKAQIFFWMKARQLGWSTLMAIYFAKHLLHGKRYLGLVISGTRDKAVEFLTDRLVFILDNLARKIVIPKEKTGTDKEIVIEFNWPWDNKNQTTAEVWVGDARVKSLAANKDATQSYTSDDVLIDECANDNLAYVGAKTFQIAKESINKANGNLFVMSAFNAGTFFNNYSQQILSGKIKGVIWDFANCFSDPNYTKEDYDRDLSQAADEMLFKSQRPVVPQDAFESRTGLVFPTFDDREFINKVRNPKSHIRKFNPRFDLGYVNLIGYDPGWSNVAPFLMALYDANKDHLWVYDEIDLGHAMQYKDRVAAAVAKLKEWREWCDVNTVSEFPSFIAIADTSVNRGDIREREIWDEAGITFLNAEKTDKDGSRVLLQNRVHQMKITIHVDNCPVTIHQMKNLRWMPGRVVHGVTISKDEVQAHEDDTYDLLRYFENYIRKNILRQENLLTKIDPSLEEPYSKSRIEHLKKLKNNTVRGKDTPNPYARRPQKLTERSWEAF